jgi:2-polyprenyl-3-methyl-5-hydroxy-6-metoxy-1,4-benzoquinol methylase
MGPACILWRCPGCGHVIRRAEDCHASARRHPWGGRGEFDRIRTALTIRSLRRASPRPAPLDALEIGFGEGILLRALAAHGNRVSGIDPGALERGIPEDLPRIATLHLQPAETIELPEDAFDLIYGIHVVEHLGDPTAVLQAAHRWLRPGGLLYLMTPNGDSAGLKLFRDAWWNLEDPTHVRFYSPRSIATTLRAAGFRRGAVRIPWWDSQTVEVSSLIRMFVRDPGEHGVMGLRWSAPLYAALVGPALLSRAVWPALSPSMEVLAWRDEAAPFVTH